MTRTPRVLAGLMFAVLVTLTAVFLCLGQMSIEIPEHRNVYVVYLDQQIFELGHGDTVEVRVQVTPPDQPLSFRLTGADSRVTVSVDAETGAQRTVTIHDTTSGFDDPDGANEILIRAYLPDGTEARTDLDQPINIDINLTETLEEALKRLREKMAEWFDGIPNALTDMAGSTLRDQAVQQSSNDGQPLSPEAAAAYKQAGAAAAKLMFEAWGVQVRSDLDNKLYESADTLRSTRVPRSIASPQEQNLNTTFALIPVRLATCDGVPCTWSSFVASPLDLSFAPWLSQPTFQLDMNARSASFNAAASTTFSINNQFGGTGIGFDTVNVQFGWKFYWPQRNP